MAKEEWKPVKNYEGLYEISSKGRIRSLDRISTDKNGMKKRFKGQILKPAKVGIGYETVLLCDAPKRKTEYIHVLMAEVFLNHERDGYATVIDHIDNNPSNNKLDNIRLISHRENISKGFQGRKNKTSKYTGVCRIRSTGKWQANIMLDKEIKYLGSFDDEYDAHLAYEFELYHWKNLNNKFE